MSKTVNKVIKMDAKRKTSANEGQALNFLHEVKQEFNRVEWTSKEELKSYTKIVVGSTFFFGLAIYLIDLSLGGALNIINAAFKFLIG